MQESEQNNKSGTDDFLAMVRKRREGAGSMKELIEARHKGSSTTVQDYIRVRWCESSLSWLEALNNRRKQLQKKLASTVDEGEKNSGNGDENSALLTGSQLVKAMRKSACNMTNEEIQERKSRHEQCGRIQQTAIRVHQEHDQVEERQRTFMR